MKIGIDLDGVVIDSETTFRVYEEIFAIEELKKEIKNKNEPKYQKRYDWTKEEQDLFNQTYLRKAGLESNIMPGFLPVYEKLKKMNYEFIVITARGKFINEMKDDAIELLNKYNIKFDKYYWNVDNKVDICKKEEIDIMIDDDYNIIRDIIKEKIKTLYFRDTNLRKIHNSKYAYEVNNWGDVYRYFNDLNRR